MRSNHKFQTIGDILKDALSDFDKEMIREIELHPDEYYERQKVIRTLDARFCGFQYSTHQCPECDQIRECYSEDCRRHYEWLCCSCDEKLHPERFEPIYWKSAPR